MCTSNMFNNVQRHCFSCIVYMFFINKRSEGYIIFLGMCFIKNCMMAIGLFFPPILREKNRQSVSFYSETFNTNLKEMGFKLFNLINSNKTDTHYKNPNFSH